MSAYSSRDAFVKHEPVRSFDGPNDNTWAARHAAVVNNALCSHRFKTDFGRTATCNDCSLGLIREANKFKTGKTSRTREASK